MKIRYSILLLLLVVLTFSCQKTNERWVDDRYINIISVIDNVDARVDRNNFVPGDVIGLYGVLYDVTNSFPGGFPEDTFTENTPLTFTGSAWVTENGSKLPWPDMNRKTDLFAYYPYDESWTGSNPDELPFTVRSEQTTEVGYVNSDLIWSKATAASSSTGTADMIFDHMLSKVNVNVTTQIEAIAEQLPFSTATVLDVPVAAYFDIDGGSVVLNGTIPESDVSLYNLPVTTTGYDVSFTGIVVPHTAPAGDRFIHLRVNETDYFYRPTDVINFMPGSTVTFNISVTATGLSVVVEAIDDWDDGGTEEGEVGTEAPKVIDIEALDWSGNASWIYRIYDRNVLVAEVAREYLFRTAATAVNNQAIVVYPVNTDGQIDYSYGFVAQLMGPTRNLTTDTYDPLTTSVHGGTVSFDMTTNSITSYAAGTLPLIGKIELVSNNQVVAADENAIPTLTAVSYTVVDVDGDTYPLVKVGTQVWTRKNSMVEHYRDGSELQVFYFNNNRSNRQPYGGLYAWAAITDVRGVAPQGWHVPSSEEWTMLGSYLMPNAGAKLKANRMWQDLNYNNNVTGWNGLPTGRRTDTGIYDEFNRYGQWWSSTPYSATLSYRLYLDYGNTSMHLATVGLNYTQSLRFLRD